MSKQLTVMRRSGNSVYAMAMVLKGDNRGRWFNNATGLLENFVITNWAAYRIPLSELGTSGIYQGSVPTALMPETALEVHYFDQRSTSPSISDTRIATIVYSNTNGWQLDGTFGAEDVTIPKDEVTQALMIVDYAHHEVHSGSRFSSQVSQMVSDINDRTAIGFKTADSTKLIHMYATVVVSDIAEFIIREGPTVADNQGASQAALNRRRDSTNVSSVLDTSQNPDLVGSVTYFAEADQAHVTENGTLLYDELLSGDKKAGGGASRGEGEWMLAPDTQYVFYLKSLTNNDNYHGIILDWYEHTDK